MNHWKTHFCKSENDVYVYYVKWCTEKNVLIKNWKENSCLEKPLWYNSFLKEMHKNRGIWYYLEVFMTFQAGYLFWQSFSINMYPLEEDDGLSVVKFMLSLVGPTFVFCVWSKILFGTAF